MRPTRSEAEVDDLVYNGTLCEDYPCCGHTPEDPCTRQPYDDHDWYSDPHLMCDHEAGVCDAEDYDDD